MEKISVLIPTYNREEFLPSALESIQKQTYEDIDIIIYDDGSSDGTVQFVEERQRKDNRIKLIVGKKNVGCPYARNKLIEACETRYAVWQDSDDISNIFRIQLQYDVIKEADYCVQCARDDINEYTLGLWRVYPQKCGVTIGFATMMFPVLKDVLFDEIFKLGGEDMNWLGKMHRRLNGRSLVVPQVLYYTRYHSNRIGAWKKKLQWYFTREEKMRLSYEEMINIFKGRQRKEGK